MTERVVMVCAVALLSTVGSSFGATSARLETRLLAQILSGSGSTYLVAPAPSLTFAVGTKVRLTVQYRLVDTSNPPAASTASVRGLTLATFNLFATGTAPGISHRSTLTGDTAATGGEAYSLPGAAGADVYPDAHGANPDALTGLHNAYRFIADHEGDTHAANGQFVGRDITRVTGEALSAAPFPQFGEGLWMGLYSFEFWNTGVGSVSYAFAPTTTTTNPNGQFRYWRRGQTTPQPSTQFSNGTITLTFAVPTPGTTAGVIVAGLTLGRRKRRLRADAAPGMCRS